MTERRTDALALALRGRVQGVGFRPYVYSLAVEHGLAGTVRNHAGTVEVEIEGFADDLDRFLRALPARAPALARIDSLDVQRGPARGHRGFRILPSSSGDQPPVLVPDTSPCEACLREVFDPADRHHGYPFLSCTACGPRLTIVEGAPWDRERTTMAPFPLCSACREAFEDPLDRRFHAQPIACPACGPALRGGTVDGLAASLREGLVGALKSVGGFHLVCDARNAAAVAALRARKHRPDEPFAVMVGSLDDARREVDVSEAEARALAAPPRPIVLCRLRADATIARAVAPSLDRLGVMLPPSVLHELLARALPCVPLVMTSANVHGAPMIHSDEDGDRLAALADVVLGHERRIAVRIDDSVIAFRDERPRPIRLARGAAPLELELPGALAEPTLAMGGHLKSAFLLARDRCGVLGPHVGDLDDVESERSYEALLDRFEALYRTGARRAVVDRHPDYATRRIAERRGLALVEVDHHHAHLASCMAEHGLEGEVLGVILDGAGLGPDGTMWGGELLAGGYAQAARAGHLRAVRLPGGDRAILEPWRLALVQLRDAEIDPTPWLEGIAAQRVRAVDQMISRGVHSPLTTSAGRLFDAAAYLAGLVRAPTFDAHGPMWLEAAAARGGPGAEPYPFAVDARGPIVIDPRPMWPAFLADVQSGRPVGVVAASFHEGLARAVASAAVLAAERHGLERVVLGGGVFSNARLSEAVASRLSAAGLSVYQHERVPPNDGGLALGQIAICAARDAEGG